MPNFKDKLQQNLSDLVFLLELNNENIFKIKAFKNALEIINALSEENLKNQDLLKNTKGIGKGILELINTISHNQEPLELTELKNNLPISLKELTKISGLGVKRIKTLWQELKIKNLGELEYACKENRLLSLKGFGASIQKNIIESLKEISHNQGLLRLDQALKISDEILEILNKLEFDKICLVAQACWQQEIIDNISFAVLTKDIENNINFAYKNMAINLYITNNKDNFGFFCFKLNSDKKFFDNINNLARSKNIDLEKSKFIEEKEIFDILNIHYVEPQIRHKTNVLTHKSKPIKKLIELSDLQGAFHNHTLASDGKNSLEEMRIQAIKLGLNYISINDHSKQAFYANGLSDELLEKQLLQINKLNNDDLGKKCWLFSGTESDILANGELDFKNNTLSKLDVIIASVHMRLKQNEAEMTCRLINAVKNPYATILGHPTGRLLLARKPSIYDMEAVIKEAKNNLVALELNANPHRLDLCEEHLVLAKELGALICINADAHSTSGLHDLAYGIMIAKRAGLTAQDVLNCQSVYDIRSWLNQKKIKAGI